MALRFYLVPKVGDGLSPSTAFRPKYISDLGLPYTAMDYGLENTMLAGVDLSAAQHTSVSANADVTAIPQNLDSQVGGALTQVQTAMENLLIPGDWILATHTYRQVIGAVGRIFLFMQRFHARHVRRFFESGITLATTMSALTQAQRDALNDAATSLGLDTSSVTGSTTVRQALRIIATQLPAFTLAGESF